MKKVAFYTLGCKLNFSETSSIGRLFTNAGYVVCNFNEYADYYIINTCSVTEHADKKCKKVVQEALRISPNAKIVIVGCYAQLKPKEIVEIPGVSLVLGAKEKFNIIQHIHQLEHEPEKKILHSEIADVNSFTASYSFGDRTRSFLKIQDGCDYNCTFCTIPLARGNSRSDTISSVLRNIDLLVQQGVKEIVLTGVNIGDFGKINGNNKHDVQFLNLLQAIEKTENNLRFRISSIEPNLLTREIIQFVAQSSKFMPHFHIPLQSGNNKILKLMRRRYLRELYADRVEEIKKYLPQACIGVDVIVGFPQETHEDFLETYNFINKLDISYLHVFTYSERENTLAAKMSGTVLFGERKQRNEMLRILSEKKKHFFYETYLKQYRPVLWEAEQNGSFMYGFTDNYIKVKTLYDPLLVNEISLSELQMFDENHDIFSQTQIQYQPH